MATVVEGGEPGNISGIDIHAKTDQFEEDLDVFILHVQVAVADLDVFLEVRLCCRVEKSGTLDNMEDGTIIHQGLSHAEQLLQLLLCFPLDNL